PTAHTCHRHATRGLSAWALRNAGITATLQTGRSRTLAHVVGTACPGNKSADSGAGAPRREEQTPAPRTGGAPHRGRSRASFCAAAIAGHSARHVGRATTSHGFGALPVLGASA